MGDYCEVGLCLSSVYRLGSVAVLIPSMGLTLSVLIASDFAITRMDRNTMLFVMLV